MGSYYESRSGQTPAIYNVFKGDYTGVEVTEDRNFETFTREHLAGALNRASDADVVVFMDVGAGAAVSAMRVALEFEPAIRESRLAVVTSSLSSVRSDYISAADPSIRKEMRQLNSDTDGLMHELQTDFSPGSNATIILPNGTALSLQGKVTQLHERVAVTRWGSLAQILAVGELVARDGIHMVSSHDIDQNIRVGRSEDYYAVTEFYAARGFEMHQLRGRNDQRTYHMFVGPEANPPGVAKGASANSQLGSYT